MTAYIDHSALKPDTVISDIESVCRAAIEHESGTVCVPPLFVRTAKKLTAETGIKVSTVIGFPFGYSAIEAKVAEIVLAIIDGADELEMVVNTSAVKNSDWQYLANEINTVMPVARGKGKKMTVIIETGLFTNGEIITACDIYGAAGIDFVKAGTGYFDDALIIDKLKLIRKHLATAVQLKVAVTTENYSAARNLIDAGANRLCCNSSLKLVKEELQQN